MIVACLITVVTLRIRSTYEVIKAEVGIFEDITSKQREAIKNCKGVSLGGSY